MICSHDFLILLVHYCFSHRSHRDREGKRERAPNRTPRAAQMGKPPPDEHNIFKNIPQGFILSPVTERTRTNICTNMGISHMTIETSGSHLRGHGVNTTGWSQCGGLRGEGKGQKVKAINLFVTVYGYLLLIHLNST